MVGTLALEASGSSSLCPRITLLLFYGGRESFLMKNCKFTAELRLPGEQLLQLAYFKIVGLHRLLSTKYIRARHYEHLALEVPLL